MPVNPVIVKVVEFEDAQTLTLPPLITPLGEPKTAIRLELIGVLVVLSFGIPPYSTR